jgi:hypothetical protein
MVRLGEHNPKPAKREKKFKLNQTTGLDGQPLEQPFSPCARCCVRQQYCAI